MKVTWVEADGWAGVYRDGKLVYQSDVGLVEPVDLLSELGFRVRQIRLDWDDPDGFPDRLEELIE